MDDDFWDSQMMQDSFAYSGEDQVSAWNKFKAEFALKNRFDRIMDLRKVDSWVGDDPRPTKSFASTWSKQRELLALHNDLMKIGR